ncbi:MAG: BatD family protein [bacterium]
MTGKKLFWPMLVLLIQVILTAIGPAQATSFSVRASANKTTLTLDDYLTLSVVIEGSEIGSIPNPELPGLPHFTVVSSSQGSNFSWINGKVSVSKTIQYILRPLKAGTFTIPPVKVSHGNITHQTDPITVTVTNPSPQSQAPSFPPPKSPPAPSPKSPPAPSPAAPLPGKRNRNTRPGRENIFITNTVDKARAYVNEQIILTFRLYRRIDLWPNPTYSQTPLQGFWEEELETSSASNVQVVNGKQYRVQEIKKALFPTSPGEYVIGPATLTYQTGFFGAPRTLKTEPITIKVLPLPEKGRPDHFKGAVGDFTISAHVDSQAGVQNEPITLHVKIKGNGHIESIPQPDLQTSPGFQEYETTASQTISRHDRIEGEKNFDFLLIPRETGNLQIPPVTFSFFHPEKEKYYTLTTELITISVSPSQTRQTGVSPLKNQGKVPDKREITLIQDDIRYIKTNVDNLRTVTFIFENKIYWCIMVIPLFGFLACFRIDRRRQKLLGDQAYARLKRAYRRAKKNLQQAQFYDKKGQEKEFYTAISKSLTEYVADKLNVQAAGLTNQHLTGQLKDRGVPGEILEQLERCLNTCDYARFAPTNGDAQARKDTLMETEHLITTIEKITRGREKR